MKKRVITIIITAALILTACSSNGNERSRSKSDRDDDENGEVEQINTPTSEPANTPTPIPEVYSIDGDYIIFGHYEQDGDISNGSEPIEWEIVREEDGRMLLISRYILDAQPYNTESTAITWETCSLRAWLNDDFINAAFDASEQARILTVTNSNPDNALWGIEGGNDTEDRVFCLSVEEVLDNYEFGKWDEEHQNGFSQSLMTEVTQYAIDNGVKNHEITSTDYYSALESCGFTDDCIGLTCGSWWFRSPGDRKFFACYVFCYNGRAGWGWHTEVNLNEIGVRPALYLSVD